MKDILRKSFYVGVSLLVLSCGGGSSSSDDKSGVEKVRVATGITAAEGVPSSATQGNYYFDQNSKTLYKKDGTQWQKLQTLGITAGKSLLSGTTAPATTSGTDGDYYLHTTLDNIYVKKGGSWVPVNSGGATVINFTDANLKKALLALFGKPANGVITVQDAQKPTLVSLDLRNKGITNLSGLEYFTNVKTLDVSGNSLTTLAPVNQLAKLTELRAYNNKLFGEVDLSKLALLDKVKIVEGNLGIEFIKINSAEQGNKFNREEKTVKYTNTGQIDQFIIFTDNNLKAALLGKATTGLDFNQDGEISVMEAESYTGHIVLESATYQSLQDLKYFKNINTLRLSSVTVRGSFHLEVSDFPNIVNLEVGNSGLQSISLQNLPKLKVLKLPSNNLTTFSVENLTSITELIANSNIGLTLISGLDGLVNLQKLNLLNCKLSGVLDLSRLEKLAEVFAQEMSNPKGERAVLALKKSNSNAGLVQVKLSNASFASQMNQLEGTSVYEAEGYKPPRPVSIPDTRLKTLLSRAVGTGNPINTETLANVKTLSLDNIVRDLSGLEHLVNLTSLTIAASVTTADISNLKKLEILDLSGSTLNSINIGELPALSQVKISAGKLLKLDLSKCTALQKVDIRIQTGELDCVKVPAKLVTTLQQTSTYKKDVIKAECQ